MRCGATPPSTRATSVATVLSPQSKRWPPSAHKSPGSATGCAGGSGASSGSVRPWVLSANNSPSSNSSKPVRLRSNPASPNSANFEREHLKIPAGVERQLVVGEHIGAALRRREVRQDDARHLVEAEQIHGAHPCVFRSNVIT